MSRKPSQAPTPANPESGASVELHIEQLTVEGVGPGDARRLGAALEGRLGALLQERGVPEALRGASVDLPSLGLDELELSPLATPEQSGVALAEALYRRLGQPLGSEPGGEEP